MKTLDIRGCPVAYQDVGHGDAVILVHCSSASHRMWASLTHSLKDRYRVLAPDLIGYGRSRGWPAGRPFEPLADVEILLRLAEVADGPVHLAAHSYGGAIGLEAARSLGRRVSSLTLIEPVAFWLLRQAGRAREWNEVLALAERIRRAYEEGDEDKAAAVYMRFWIGSVAWWLAPPRRRKRIVQTVGKVAAEFAAVSGITTALEEYASISAPCRIIVGGCTRAPARAVAEIVRSTLPHAHERFIRTAGHMSPFTHPRAVRRLIVEHMEGSGGKGSVGAGGALS